MLEKICTKCKVPKPECAFSKHPASPSGIRPYCKQCASFIEKQRRLNEPEKIRAADRARYVKNPEKKKKYSSERYHSDPKTACVYNREQSKKRKMINPLYKLSCQIRNLIGIAFKNGNFTKKSRTAIILGCTFGELKQHLEKQFIDNMSWENRHLWHIDHIIPISSSAKTEEEIVRLNHFSNLRPLWAKDNLEKGCKMPQLEG